LNRRNKRSDNCEDSRKPTGGDRERTYEASTELADDIETGQKSKEKRPNGFSTSRHERGRRKRGRSWDKNLVTTLITWT